MRWQTVQDERAKYDAAIPTAMVMEERKEPRETYVLHRGRYDQPDKGPKAAARCAGRLPPLPADAPRQSAGPRAMAREPGKSAHGAGHRQSTVAASLRRRVGEDVRQFRRAIRAAVASGVARLAGDRARSIGLGSAAHSAADRLAATPISSVPKPRRSCTSAIPIIGCSPAGPRYRLPAEALRDNALAVSGLLVDKIGGPSVMPYQPAGLWEELAGGAHDDYTQGHGDDLYRRSLYMYRKRTVPHPSMATFDAPSWEICQVKRARTNTPLQALALLNDVTYMEAARKFAERMLTEGGSSADSQLTFAFRLATSRAPTAERTCRAATRAWKSIPIGFASRRRRPRSL